MQFVTKPANFSAPGWCPIVPGRRTDERGFIDTGTTLDGIQGPLNIYLSVGGLRLIASRYPQVGLVDSESMREVTDENARLVDENEMLRAQLKDAEAKLDRINGIAKDGFKVVRQQGRPPVKK